MGASAMVTWTPRISAGEARGWGVGFAGGAVAVWPFVEAATFESRSVRNRAPRVVPAAASAKVRLAARRFRACRRRSRNLSFGSTGSRSMNPGTLMESPSRLQELKPVDATLCVALGFGHACGNRAQGGGAQQGLPFAAKARCCARCEPGSGEPLAARPGNRSRERGAARPARARHVLAPPALRAGNGGEVALRAQSAPS